MEAFLIPVLLKPLCALRGHLTPLCLWHLLSNVNICLATTFPTLYLRMALVKSPSLQRDDGRLKVQYVSDAGMVATRQMEKMPHRGHAITPLYLPSLLMR